MTKFLLFNSKKMVYSAAFKLSAAESLKPAWLEFVIRLCFILTISSASAQRDWSLGLKKMH